MQENFSKTKMATNEEKAAQETTHDAQGAFDQRVKRKPVRQQLMQEVGTPEGPKEQNSQGKPKAIKAPFGSRGGKTRRRKGWAAAKMGRKPNSYLAPGFSSGGIAFKGL